VLEVGELHILIHARGVAVAANGQCDWKEETTSTWRTSEYQRGKRKWRTRGTSGNIIETHLLGAIQMKAYKTTAKRNQTQRVKLGSSLKIRQKNGSFSL
jgi:hypothetical protein